MEDNTSLNRKSKILIVEDNEIDYFLIFMMIEEIEASIFHVMTGPEAVCFCRENPDIDLILMDIRIPELNGYDATREIRTFNKEVIIIAQTAYGYSTDRQKALESGCNDFIAKPLTRSELISIISKFSTRKLNAMNL